MYFLSASLLHTPRRVDVIDKYYKGTTINSLEGLWKSRKKFGGPSPVEKKLKAISRKFQKIQNISILYYTRQGLSKFISKIIFPGEGPLVFFVFFSISSSPTPRSLMVVPPLKFVFENHKAEIEM